MARKPRNYWQRTRATALAFVAIATLFAVLLPLAAPQLEAIAVMGLPLSYYAGAQGIPIALALAAFVFVLRQRRIDRAATATVEDRQS